MTSLTKELPHVAVCPSAGIGHLLPFLRLASMLANTNACNVTLVTIRPTTSTVEATQIDTFLATHPSITSTEFHSLPHNTSDTTIRDPFLLQYDAISRSAHLLVDHLTEITPKLSAVFLELQLASGVNKPLCDLGIPNFILMTSSARFYALMFSLLKHPLVKGNDVILPGVPPILSDEVPSMMYTKDHAFLRLITTNVAHFCYSNGILINNFDYFEPDTISALQTGEFFKDLPPVFPIGPLHPLDMEKGSNFVSWLDQQPSKSVIFVSFGSRTALSKEQIKEIGEGLQRSGLRFLWVIKTTVVDKEDTEDLNSLLGEEFFEKTTDRGLILKEWVNQEEVLAHPSVGGFLSHCGWNSCLEAAERGMPVLAWPPGGDQKVNASVLRDAGLGIWERRWGRQGELIKADEIKDKVKELMTNDELKISAKRVGDEARKAWEVDGSSTKMFQSIIDVFAKTPQN